MGYTVQGLTVDSQDAGINYPAPAGLDVSLLTVSVSS